MAKTNITTGWRFLDKDPGIDLWREAMRRSGKSFEEIEASGGPVVQTMRNWDTGATIKPHRLSYLSAMQGAGFHEQWVDGQGVVLKATYKVPPRPKTKTKTTRRTTIKKKA